MEVVPQKAGEERVNGNLNNNDNSPAGKVNGQHHQNGGNDGPVNGNGFHHHHHLPDDTNEDDLFPQRRNSDNNSVGSRKSQRLKMNFQNVETFIKLNGNEKDEDGGDGGGGGGGGKWTKTESPPTFGDGEEDNELQRAVQKALQDISHAAANGVQGEAIIFKDEEGKAPPITMTFLKKKEDPEEILPEAPELVGEPPRELHHPNKASSLINPNFIGDIPMSLPGGDKQTLKILPPPSPPTSSDNPTVNGANNKVVINFHETPSPAEALLNDRNRNVPASQQGNDRHILHATHGNQQQKLHVITKKKQEDRRAQFETLQNHYKLDADAQGILALDWDVLLAKLQTRELRAVQVLSAFIAKSLEATAFCNAITEFYPRAVEMAEELDRMPTVKGPLHGVPFCVKDDTDLEGMDSTLGYAKRCFNPALKSAALVLTLVDLGGIPFCKTNVPQTLLNFASDNPVFGATTSSHNQKLGPGGSSSGTGALVGSYGTMFGTGTDIGGSLRIPAHFNGVSSIKPTGGRLSVRGVSAVLPNVMGLDATIGIIAQKAKIVASVFRSMLRDNLHAKFDPKIPPIPWNDELYTSTKKLRIGYFSQVPYFPPVGDTVEVVENAMKALRSMGHSLIPMEIPDGGRIMRCATNFLLADNSQSLKTLWKGEEVAKCAELNKLGARCPAWVLKLASYLMHRKLLSFLYSPALGSILDCGAFKSHQLWENTGEQKKICDEMLATWTNLQLDCCICPVMPFPAIPLNLPGLLPVAAVYTMTWNVVNFPAGVVKFGVESGQNIDQYDNRGDQALKMSQQACKESIGSPIGVQVVGLPFKEELVLRVMQELDDYAAQNKMFV